MKKINIAVIGPIGVGKSTFIEKLKTYFTNSNYNVIVVNEPSVSILPVNQLLERLYEDVSKWAYPLQAAISASHEAEFEMVKETSYDISIFDMPYSSFLYCNIHHRHKRMSKKEKDSIIEISRPFPFDYLISLNAEPEDIIERVKQRNLKCRKRSKKNTTVLKDNSENFDLEIKDYSYLEEHIEDFDYFKEAWIDRFFKKSKLYNIALDDLSSKKYNEKVEYIGDIILEKISKFRIEEIEGKRKFLIKEKC